MTDLTIASDGIECVVTTAGGAIWRLDALSTEGAKIPLLRSPPSGPARDALHAACFPFVPFGNRVAGNSFRFRDKTYRLEPNTARDPHYLHGDGWLGQWSVLDHEPHRVRLGFAYNGSVYRYEAQQTFAADARGLTATLAVTNMADDLLPFGVGWHPFLPLGPQTTLKASATSYWTEGAGFLPDAQKPIPTELDFSAPRDIPRHWVNGTFEGWDGRARIDWPERGISLVISTIPTLSRYVIFVSDKTFDPAYAGDFFCFEPMSHTANGHNLADLGCLTALAPGESLSGSMRLAWGEFAGAPQS